MNIINIPILPLMLYKPFLYIIAFISFTACSQSTKKYISPPGYNLEAPQKFTMRENLQEISGIALHNGDPATFYALQDEQGKLFWFGLQDEKTTHLKFAKQGDYEDLAILDNKVVILKSNGSFFVMPLPPLPQAQEDTTEITELKKILPDGEYESLYADEKTNTIYTICKKCVVDKKTDNITGYILKPTKDSLTITGNFTIDIKLIEALTTEKKIEFKPSAMAKNSLTNEWYFVSSIGKNLLVTDYTFKPKALYSLNSATFRQPEGLAFDKEGNLYISNEGDETGNGNILKFVLKK